MKALRDLSAQFNCIVETNEGIKRVIDVSHKINLMAVNASLAARRAGHAARGFGIVSSELRQFARRLERNMEALRDLIYQTVSAISNLIRHTLISEVLGRVATTHQIQGSHQAEGARILQRVDDLGRGLARLLLLSNRIADAGEVLARMARIEAAHAGAHQRELTQVSEEFEHWVKEVDQCLNDLLARMQEHAG